MSHSRNSADVRLGRLLCRILRHHPEQVGITLDEHGWADVEELLAALAGCHPIDRAKLEELVRTDAKQRYSMSADGRLIRANQGHSIPVDVELPLTRPPGLLWHGTGEKYAASIDAQGLLPRSRLYVHLSSDEETARAVGRRHGRPVLYQVRSGQMRADGIPFYRSVNGVWLTRAVPARYLERQPGPI